MINFEIGKNQKTADFSATNYDSFQVLEFYSSFNDTIILRHHVNSTIEVIVDEGAKVEFVELFENDTAELTRSLNIKTNGQFHHVIISKANVNTLSIKTHADEFHNGYYQQVFLDFSNGNLKVSNEVALSTENAICNLYTAVVADNNNIKNVLNNIINYGPMTQGYMENYGVSFKNATIDIVGIGDIKRGAYKSIHRQKSTLYNMDDDSRSTSKPYLYISEDDVEASHASAVGQIDEETIYYLCSRGIEKQAARKMVVLGYFKPFIDKVKCQYIIDYIGNLIGDVIKNA